MIAKQDGQRGGTVRVSFELPGDIAQSHVAVVGDFNDWNPEAHPMRRLKKGTWKKDIYLAPDQSYRFRYLVDGTRWHNDDAADRFEPNGYNTTNSVIET